jgi:ribosomal protein S6
MCHRPLAQAAMWQLTFASNAQALNEIDHSLRVDERVLRWVVLKRRPYGPLPNSYRVARTAEQVAQSLSASSSPSNQPL